MGRGIVSGLIWGMLLSVLVLAGISLNMPLPERPTDRQAGPSAPVRTPASSDVALPQALPQEQAEMVVENPQGQLAAPLPAPVPETDMLQSTVSPTLESATEAPQAVSNAGPVTAPIEDRPSPPAEVALRAPVQPPRLDLQQTPLAALDEGGDAAVTVATLPSAPMAQRPETGPTVVEDAAPLPPMPGAISAPAAAPVMQLAPERLPNTEAVRVLPQVALPKVALPDATSTPAVPAPPQVALDRLDTPPQAAPRMPDTDAAPGALLRNAVEFTAAPARPLMSVILIDDPDGPLGDDILAQISFPISFAIDPSRPDAAARAAFLREAGFEVLILASAALPAGAGAADVELSLAAAQQAIPQAVAMLDSPESRIQADRPVLEALIAILVESGHGLVAFPRNLNAAEQAARREGVASATAFRLLDDSDQRAPVITRYLDRAAFAAGQEGAVIVVGRSRPDTITALFSWALGGRGEGVTLAPISAVLRRLSE